jgi:hypothetical protein
VTSPKTFDAPTSRVAPMTSPKPYESIAWITSDAVARHEHEEAEAFEYMGHVKAPMSTQVTTALIQMLQDGEIPRRKVRKRT